MDGEGWWCLSSTMSSGFSSWKDATFPTFHCCPELGSRLMRVSENGVKGRCLVGDLGEGDRLLLRDVESGSGCWCGVEYSLCRGGNGGRSMLRLGWYSGG